MAMPQCPLFCRRRGLVLALFGPCALRAAPPLSLRVGWDEYPPYQLAPERPGAEPGGLDPEMLRRWLPRAGLGSPRFVQMPWPRQLLSLQTGELDAMMDASRVPERESWAVWTEPYRRARVALIALTETARPVASLAALRGSGSRIALVRGSLYPGEFARLADDAEFQRLLLPVRHTRQALDMLRLRRVDYLIGDPEAVRQQSRGGVSEVLGLVSNDARLMLSRRLLLQHPDLLSQLNRALASA